MVHGIFNIVSMILSIATALYLFNVASKCVQGIKKGINLLAIGVLVALGIHSFTEFLEAFGYTSTATLINIMPILVSIGSIFLIIGAYILYKTLSPVKKT